MSFFIGACNNNNVTKQTFIVFKVEITVGYILCIFMFYYVIPVALSARY